MAEAKQHWPMETKKKTFVNQSSLENRTKKRKVHEKGENKEPAKYKNEWNAEEDLEWKCDILPINRLRCQKKNRKCNSDHHSNSFHDAETKNESMTT